jgi:hypothetical protein
MDKLTAVAAEIWADGLRHGTIAGQNERDLLVKERDVLWLAFAEAAARADTQEERLQNLTRRAPSAPFPTRPAIIALGQKPKSP